MEIGRKNYNFVPLSVYVLKSGRRRILMVNRIIIMKKVFYLDLDLFYYLFPVTLNLLFLNLFLNQIIFLQLVYGRMAIIFSL